MSDKPPPVTVRNELRKGKAPEAGEAKGGAKGWAVGPSAKGQQATGGKQSVLK